MSKSEKGKNQCIRELVYQDIRELGYQYIYPHCFASLAPVLSTKAVPGAASLNKAWGCEKKIKNKANLPAIGRKLEILKRKYVL